MVQLTGIKHIIFSALFALALCGAPAAQAQEDLPAVSPTSAWLVGPASLAANIGNISSRIPCVVANQFSNGFVLRFSGGGGKLMALAIDFRQKVFTPRQRYDVEFSVPGQFFQMMNGGAYDEGTLIFSFQKMPDLYDVMQKAETLVVKVQGQVVAFTLIGLDEGFERMEMCYNPAIHGPKPLAPPVGPQPTPESQKTPTTKQSSLQNPLIAQDVERLTPMPGEEGIAPLSASPEKEVPSLVEKARQAEKVAQDLAGRSLQKKQAPPSPVAGNAMAAGWSDGAQHRNHADIMVNNGKEAPPSEMLWRALKGANLQQVLDIWTRNTGAQFIWAADQEFVIQKSISFQGSFDSAIRTLMTQYDGQNPRPHARIDRQPQTGNPVLVIELGNIP